MTTRGGGGEGEGRRRRNWSHAENARGVVGWGCPKRVEGRARRLEKETVGGSPTDADPKTRRKPTRLRARTSLPQNRECGFPSWVSRLSLSSLSLPDRITPEEFRGGPPHIHVRSLRRHITPELYQGDSSLGSRCQESKCIGFNLFTIRAATQPQSAIRNPVWSERGVHALLSLSLGKIPEIYKRFE
ncbi:hypothetical protein OPV22_018983 [Ensete ventricosum]|uniref:Uncharacterized protein n=1 Tax=Ensete ventricosum TaxID=4639 RepID=A0AAV8R5T6_ENSVE|nr:hypothetical protein OPV22_018983 [Ensete ventricosum]